MGGIINELEDGVNYLTDYLPQSLVSASKEMIETCYNVGFERLLDEDEDTSLNESIDTVLFQAANELLNLMKMSIKKQGYDFNELVASEIINSLYRKWVKRGKIRMKVKKWVRTLAKTLFIIGAFVMFGLAGNCEVYPNYPMSKVLIYSCISAICFLPYLLIFAYESEDD